MFELEPHSCYTALKPASREAPMRAAAREITGPFIGVAICVLVSVALTLLGSALVCVGMWAESIAAAEWAAPLAGLICGATWAGRHARRAPWAAGLGVGIILVGLWFGGWLYLIGRGSPLRWVHEALPALTIRHLIAWSGTVALAALAGVAGGRLARKRTRAHLVLCAAAALLVPGAMLASGGVGSPDPAFVSVPVPGADRPDGTTVRVFRFGAASETFTLGLYDADSDDASPWDDHNRTWLGQTTEFVLDKLRARAHRRGHGVLAVVNAGFFNLGADRGYVGSHVAPVVIDGVPRYNVRTLRRGDPGWVFGVRRGPDGQRFDLAEAVPWDQMASRYEVAIAWVRPLRVDGRSLPLRPGLGATDLRCSRSSLGWSADSRELYLLVARDPDGETGSIGQWRDGRRQTGGLDVREVQRIWEQLGVPYALLLDGGDSTQMAFRERAGRHRVVRSACHVSRTLGYWRDRPLRLFLPMLPTPQVHGGVMNYLYVEAEGSSGRRPAPTATQTGA